MSFIPPSLARIRLADRERITPEMAPGLDQPLASRSLAAERVAPTPTPLRDPVPFDRSIQGFQSDRFPRLSEPEPPQIAPVSLAAARLSEEAPEPADISVRESRAPMPRYPFTPRPEYQDAHKPGEHVGVGGTIMHGLKSIGMGFMRGGVPGAVAGGIGGFSDPNYWHRAKYQYQTLPLWQQRLQEEKEVERAQSAYQKTQAEIENFETDNQFTRDREARVADEHKSAQELRKGQIDALAQDRREKYAEEAVKMSQTSGTPVSAAAVKGTSKEMWAGKVVPKTSALTVGEQENLKRRDRDFAYRKEQDERRRTELTPAERRQERREANSLIKEIQSHDTTVEKAASIFQTATSAVDRKRQQTDPKTNQTIWFAPFTDEHGKTVNAVDPVTGEPKDELLSQLGDRLNSAKAARQAAQARADGHPLIEIGEADEGGKRYVKPKAEEAYRAPARKGGATSRVTMDQAKQQARADIAGIPEGPQRDKAKAIYKKHFGEDY